MRCGVAGGRAGFDLSAWRRAAARAAVRPQHRACTRVFPVTPAGDGARPAWSQAHETFHGVGAAHPRGYRDRMPSATTGPWRLVRAGVVASVVVALAGLAHVLGGGTLPAGVVLVALTSLVLAVCVALAGRRLGVVAVTAVLGVGQLVLHHAFTVLAATGCAAPVPSGASAADPHAGHTAAQHAGHVAGQATEHAAHVAGPTTEHVAHAGQALGTLACADPHGVAAPLLGASAMLVLHVVATVLTALVVAGGDRALHWLLAWLRPRVVAPGPVAISAGGTLAHPVVAVAPHRAPWSRAHPRRGPPSAPPAPPAR